MSNTICTKLAEAILAKSIVLYKDSTTGSRIPSMEQTTLLSRTRVITSDPKRVETTVKRDTIIKYNFNQNWIQALRLHQNGVLSLFLECKDDPDHKGSWCLFLRPSDYKKLLNDPEVLFLSRFNVSDGVRREAVTALFWEAISNNLKYFTRTGLVKFRNSQLTDTLSEKQYLETYQMMVMETIIQDSLHRELDYQKASYKPLTADSLKGLAWKCELRPNVSGGAEMALLPVAVSPIWDPSGSGGDPFIYENTFWIKSADYLVQLRKQDKELMATLIQLFLIDRLGTDCTF